MRKPFEPSFSHGSDNKAVSHSCPSHLSPHGSAPGKMCTFAHTFRTRSSEITTRSSQIMKDNNIYNISHIFIYLYAFVEVCSILLRSKYLQRNTSTKKEVLCHNFFMVYHLTDIFGQVLHNHRNVATWCKE
jgi:hypothetical protein